MSIDDEKFNAVAYSYRAWPQADPSGVAARYEELVKYIDEYVLTQVSEAWSKFGRDK